MPELQKLYESLNLGSVVTYIQSGNVIFDCTEKESAMIARAIESQLERSFGLSVRVLVRDTRQFQQIIENNTFMNQRKEGLEKLHVTFLANRPSRAVLSNLTIPPGIIDEFQVSDQEVYLFCPNGYGKTKLSNSFFERKFKVAATTRNWKTVIALFELANQR
jgi:uncharacterized protein (DUF1697 family)